MSLNKTKPPDSSCLCCSANNEALTLNTEVTEANGVIRFTGVTDEEQGAYICTATNAVGSVTATATLTVAGGILIQLCLIYS